MYDKEDNYGGANYTCPKCQNTQCDADEFRDGGGLLGKIATIRSKCFTTVTCRNCQYTEIYKASSSMPVNIFDLFTN
ncbi:MAG: zinc ribbon domain-containing protein [Planctomycetota bacterium]